MPTQTHVSDNRRNSYGLLKTATCGVRRSPKFCYGSSYGLDSGPDNKIPFKLALLSLLMRSQQHTKLLSLQDPIKFCLHQYITQTCSLGPDDRSLTDIGGGYHVEVLNFRSKHSSSFPSSILPFPLFAPPDLQLFQSFDHLAKPHRTSIDRKGPIVSGFQPLIFYR
jgi:hypothetical protein